MCRTGEQQPMHAGGAAYNIHHRMRVRTRSACTIHALLASASEIVTHVWDPPKSIHLRIIYKGARSQRLLPQIATAITTSTHANVMHDLPSKNVHGCRSAHLQRMHPQVVNSFLASSRDTHSSMRVFHGARQRTCITE